MRSFISVICALFCLICFNGCNFSTKAKSTGIVIVGMGQSAKYGKCDGADVDAGTMNGILSKYGKPTVLLNNQATKANVLNALNNAKNNDLLIFFYSGHGGSDPIGDTSGEPDRRNEYLCLYNTYLLDNEIWSVVTSAKGRVFLIFDCCHSETMFRDPGMDLSEIITEEEMKRSGDKVNMLCWSGCADNTYSYGDKKGGYLTNAIKAAYRKSYSYNKVWNGVTWRVPKQYQVPKKTLIGKGFDRRVFR